MGTQINGSKLELMFRHHTRHGLLKRDAQQRIYLDRDPNAFSRVLDWLANNGHIDAVQNAFDRRLFEDELKFWGLDGVTQAQFIANDNDNLRGSTFNTESAIKRRTLNTTL